MGGKQTKEKDQKDSKEKNNTNDTTEKNNAILNEEKCGGGGVVDISQYLKDKKESNEYIYFKAKDIENEYSQLEREIQQLCLEKNSEEDENSNEFENFLKKIKQISKTSLDIAKILKKAIYDAFIENNKEFSNLKLKKNDQVDEGCINEFSSWCKNNLKDVDKLVQDFCHKYGGFKHEKDDFDIFMRFTKVYLKCQLCNEIIEYRECEDKCNFDNKTMYDLAEIRGVNKKVKYYILPGLFYNGAFFQDGKIHVYAYSNKQ